MKILRVARGKAGHYKKDLVSRLAKKIRDLTYTAGFYIDDPISEFLKKSIKINRIEIKPNGITKKRGTAYETKLNPTTPCVGENV